MFLRIRWEEQGRPSGGLLARQSSTWKLQPGLPRATAESWVKPWQDPSAGPSPVPKKFDEFYTFVQVLGADNDLDKEPDLLTIETAEKQWRHVHADALQEAKDARRAASRTRRSKAHTTAREPKRTRRRNGARWIAAGLISSVVAIVAILVYSSGSKDPSASASETCANVIDQRPAGVYPSPDAGTAPIKFKKKNDRIVVLDDPTARAGWVRVFTPKDPPGYQWMLAHQLGPQRPC